MGVVLEWFDCCELVWGDGLLMGFGVDGGLISSWYGDFVFGVDVVFFWF